MRSASSRIDTSLSGLPTLKIWRSHTPSGLVMIRSMQSTASSM